MTSLQLKTMKAVTLVQLCCIYWTDSLVTVCIWGAAVYGLKSKNCSNELPLLWSAAQTEDVLPWNQPLSRPHFAFKRQEHEPRGSTSWTAQYVCAVVHSKSAENFHKAAALTVFWPLRSWLCVLHMCVFLCALLRDGLNICVHKNISVVF